MMKRIINAMVASNTDKFRLVFTYDSWANHIKFKIDRTLLEQYMKEYCELTPEIEWKDMNECCIDIVSSTKHK